MCVNIVITYLHDYVTRGVMCRASINGCTGIIYARKFDQNAKLDGPAYKYASKLTYSSS